MVETETTIDNNYFSFLRIITNTYYESFQNYKLYIVLITSNYEFSLIKTRITSSHITEGKSLRWGPFVRGNFLHKLFHRNNFMVLL